MPKEVIKQSMLLFALAPVGHCEECSDEAISKRDCHALRARNDNFL